MTSTRSGAGGHGPSTGDTVSISLGQPQRQLLPPFGLKTCINEGEPTESQLALLGALRLDHLRVDLDTSGDWPGELERSARVALLLAAGLEVALCLGENFEEELQHIADALPLAQAGIRRVLLFERGKAVSGSAIVRIARQTLKTVAPEATFACGTKSFFDVLKRDPPDVEDADAVVFSISEDARVDHDLVVAGLAQQGETVRSALALLEKPVVVSPVTLREGCATVGEDEESEITPQDDFLQWELRAAAWTIASAKQLLEAGVSSFTYFEAIGPHGFITAEHEASGDTSASPEQVSPIYHVLADLGDWRKTVLVPSSSSDPRAVETLAVQSERGTHALIANLTAAAQRCTIEHSAESVELRVLEQSALGAAIGTPEAFRSQKEKRSVSRGTLQLELSPHAVVRVDP